MSETIRCEGDIWYKVALEDYVLRSIQEELKGFFSEVDDISWLHKNEGKTGFGVFSYDGSYVYCPGAEPSKRYRWCYRDKQVEEVLHMTELVGEIEYGVVEFSSEDLDHYYRYIYEPGRGWVYQEGHIEWEEV